MKVIGAFFLSLLVVFYGMPVRTSAQGATESFSLPDGTAGEVYRTNIESVLRDTYHLKLETDARASVFRWTLGQGEMPPGLIIRGNGIIAGIPRAPRAEPYQFQARVLDISSPKSEALTLDFRLTISAPRIRLARISAPRLVAAEGPDVVKQPSVINIRARQPGPEVSARSVDSSNPNGEKTSDSLITSNRMLAAARFAGVDQVYASMLKPPKLADAAPSSLPQVGACNPTAFLGAWPTGKVFVVDARNQATVGERQFEKQDSITVVVDNKNPYLYKYTYTENKEKVEETAIGSFLSLIGGVVTEFLNGTEAKKDKEPDAKVHSLAPGCDAFTALNEEVQVQIKNSQAIADPNLTSLANANKARSEHYDRIVTTLQNPQATSGELYCKSVELTAVSDPGALPHDIEVVQKMIDTLRTEAQSFKVRADLIASSLPGCASPESLNIVRKVADGLLSDAAKYDDDLKKIKADAKKMDDQKKTVESALKDPRNLRETHAYGPFSKTTVVSFGLSRTSISSGDDDKPKSEDLVKEDDTEFKFGHAPFFSLSGGLAFSPLRKLEFDRIQGFERDQQGNLVLVNGKPNLTTVVGLKETSPTRITPAIFLHGRIKGWNDHIVDGLHVSLGITAKNDSKGTDPEFLLGPSLSMLERKMFFTFGAYAGRQQKLTGGLFEGFAVPSTVTDLPIQKNYRWSFGFALSYELPVNKSK